MSITKQLREYADKCDDKEYTCLYVLADRIDAAHEKAMSEQFKSLTIDMKPMTEENMAEGGWVRLPVDADGVPINVGDWITGKWDAKAKVVAVTPDDVYWWEPDGCHWCHASEVRHHRKPTVADVLREFTRDWCDSSCTGDMTNAERDAAQANVIAEYANRIREAVTHEEER